MLSKKTKYGIKALVYLAKQENRIPVQISVISESENISRKFLESILLTLRKNRPTDERNLYALLMDPPPTGLNSPTTTGLESVCDSNLPKRLLLIIACILVHYYVHY